MSRRCFHCGHNGHNSRTCLDGKGGFKLFGVQLSTETCLASSSPGAASECSSSSATSMRKSASLGNLCNYSGREGATSSLSAPQHELGDPAEGYASDDLVHTNSSSRDKKKGVPWTEEEHRSFLTGLQALGKGDWRGISRNFVRTRTPTQVASHAQKYFLRRNNLNKRRRRSSLFDITPDPVSSVLEEPVLVEKWCEDPDVSAELSLGQSIPHGPNYTLEASRLAGHGHPSRYLPVLAPHLPLAHAPSTTSDSVQGLGRPLERQVMHITENGTSYRATNMDVMEVVPESVNVAERAYNIFQSNVIVGQAMVRPAENVHDVSRPEWMDAEFKILKPIAVIPNPLQKADETLKFPEVTINMARHVMEPTPLSFKLLCEGSRHSAFHFTVPKRASKEVDGRGGLNSAISVP